MGEDGISDLEIVCGHFGGMVFVFCVPSEESDVVDVVSVTFLCLDLVEA